VFALGEHGGGVHHDPINAGAGDVRYMLDRLASTDALLDVTRTEGAFGGAAGHGRLHFLLTVRSLAGLGRTGMSLTVLCLKLLAQRNGVFVAVAVDNYQMRVVTRNAKRGEFGTRLGQAYCVRDGVHQRSWVREARLMGKP